MTDEATEALAASVRAHIELCYDRDPQREWERVERHRTEFAVTLRALDDHLPLPRLIGRPRAQAITPPTDRRRRARAGRECRSSRTRD
jgi:hypothetical protein